MDERDVDAYLVSRLAEIGAVTRRVAWINRRGAPDRVVFHKGATYWVELKSGRGKVSGAQEREHQAMGVVVHILSNKQGIDNFIKEIL